MKSFVLSMLIGVSLATGVTVAAARAFLPEWVWEAPAQPETGGPRFSSLRREAMRAVAARLGGSPEAEQIRLNLRQYARVEEHSFEHQTVHLGDATWRVRATGQDPPTRTAEPANEAARRLEAPGS